MKKALLFISLFFAFAFFACSGSDSYLGKWKATDAAGNHAEIVFDKNTVKITESNGNVSRYSYTQNSVNLDNSKMTYGIKANNGNGYQIVFPDSNDESTGLFTDTQGTVLFTIGRKDFVTYGVSQ